MPTEGYPQDRLHPLLRDRVERVLQQRRLIVVSNRGPVEFAPGPEGHLIPRRGSGGVVTALSSLVHHADFTWIASVMGEGDRKMAERAGGQSFPSPIAGQRVSLRFVVTPRRVYHKFYNIFCNPLLWFLQHQMWNPSHAPTVDSVVYDAWETGYVAVNRAFAEAVVAEAQPHRLPPLVMFHDYHLYLAPRMVRERLPNALLHLFVHVPWPEPRYWRLLPAHMRAAICEGICACDLVGFQTSWDVRYFLETCRVFLSGARVDLDAGEVEYRGRRTRVRAYPLSIDVEEVRRIAHSPRVMEYQQHLRPLCGEFTVVRVDRVEPSKNIVRGFQAFHLFLARYPAFRGRVRFLAFLAPSRTHIKQYQRYLQEVEATVRTVNETFGTPEWQPVQVFLENNYMQALAGMRLYDVLLVNPILDGMNLVAKEGPVVNTRNGVLILSEGAGAYEQLKEGALTVAPVDLEGTVQALHRALTMSPEERAERARRLVEAVQREDITHWLLRQFQDLQDLL